MSPGGPSSLLSVAGIPDLPAWLAPFWPDPAVAAILAPASFLYALTAGVAVGRLRIRSGWPVAYTRKLYHVAIFTAALVAHATLGLPGASTYGAAVALVVLYAVWRGGGYPFYEALARPRDRPRRTLFILVPLATTAAGGLTSNLLFGDLAIVGYLVTGWGDAVGEPVGERWGRHPYRVPSLAGVPARRTAEGSAAVLLAGSLAGAIALGVAGAAPRACVTVGLACGVAATLIEAVSHHGVDNFTIQVGASGVAALLL